MRLATFTYLRSIFKASKTFGINYKVSDSEIGSPGFSFMYLFLVGMTFAIQRVL